MIRIHHVQITIPRGQEAEGREFYVEFLGLAEIAKPSTMVGRGGFWVRVGEQELHIGVEDFDSRGSTKAHVAYEVDNLAEWRGRLGERGIPITTDAPEFPGYERVKFRDPWGNLVELLQMMG